MSRDHWQPNAVETHSISFASQYLTVQLSDTGTPLRSHCPRTPGRWHRARLAVWSDLGWPCHSVLPRGSLSHPVPRTRNNLSLSARPDRPAFRDCPSPHKHDGPALLVLTSPTICSLSPLPWTLLMPGMRRSFQKVDLGDHGHRVPISSSTRGISPRGCGSEDHRPS